MSLPPRLDALLAKENKGNTYWTKLGVAFATKSENGYRVTLDAMPAPVDGSYTFMLLIPNDKGNSGNSNQNSGNSGYNNGGGGNSNSRPGANRNQDSGGMDDDIPF